VTNLAARLARIAKPGQILVGPETVQRLGRNYDIRKLTRKHLKNLDNPVDIYCLTSPLYPPSTGVLTPCRCTAPPSWDGFSCGQRGVSASCVTATAERGVAKHTS
jgi:hypothetical protein